MRGRSSRASRGARLAALILCLSVLTTASVRAADDPAPAAVLRCQRAVAAATKRFTAARTGDAGKCVGSLVRCLLGRPGDNACALRTSATCSQGYQKQAALLASLRATIRKRCDGATWLPVTGVGFAAVTDRCRVSPSPQVDGVDNAIACLADAAACASTRALAASVPRSSALLQSSGVLSSLPVGTSCLPDYVVVRATEGPTDSGRGSTPCLTAMLRAGQRDQDAWRAAYERCLGTLVTCGGAEEACRTRAAAACDTAFRKGPGSGGGLVDADAVCAEERVPFAVLASPLGANVAALAATCATLGIAPLASADDWRTCVARTAACQVAEATRFVYPQGDEALARIGRSRLPPFCPGFVPVPTRTATPHPTATASPTPTATPTATATLVPTVTLSSTPGTTPSTVATPSGATSIIATATGNSPLSPATATQTPTRTPTRTATPVTTASKSATPSPNTSATPVASGTPIAGCDADAAPYGVTTRPSNTTCRLDGSPDQFPILQVDRAFPALSFVFPVQLTYAPDGGNRLFVVEQQGRIRVFPNVENVASSSTFLDVSGLVSSGGEEGLLGLAFHPDYATNGYFYVYYSAANPRRSVIARYRVSANPALADATSAQVVLEIPQPYENHKGGQLVFGPDGMLYLSLGDGGSGGDPENRAQDLTQLLGKILRLDVDHTDPGLAYAVPADNPFVDVAGARGEIWALGVRNPWRMSFDRLTHALWAGDVGQERFEEIDLVTRGANYGWRRMEGHACYNPGFACNDGTLTEPIVTYDHGETGCSVVGGFVYRGSELPELYGAYVYGDYCSGRLWTLRWDGADATTQQLGSTSFNLSAFGEDRDGELYLVSYSGGTIHRLRRSTGAPVGTFPLTLSATGCFDDLASRHPAPGLMPYDVQVPFWSDGAGKRRFLALPDGATIGHTTSGAWNLPVGSILVKEFTLELEQGNAASARALETRFLIRRANGWDGYTYVWNDAQTEAYLLDGATTQTFPVSDPQQPGAALTYTHYYPSRSDCMRCHTPVAGGTLGLQTAQLNRTHDYEGVSDNQLRAWEHIGLFGGCLPARPANLPRLVDPADVAAPLDARARSYLHANCAHCHRPGGTAPTAIDLRADVSFKATGLCDGTPEAGDLGVAGAHLVHPGHPEESVLWLRAARRGSGQMPPLATLALDPLGSDLLADWITSLGSCP